MEVELVTPECQHPFGPGIHVIKAQGKLLAALLEAFNVHHRMAAAYAKLADLLDAGPDREKATACVLYEGHPPQGMARAWMVAKMTLTIDPLESFGHKMEMDSLAILAEEGYEEMAHAAAKGFKHAFKCGFKS
jgi:hypothetical protein